ncbi:hypothetical protein ACFXJO_05500 [Streptomyces lavendulae]|uniref:hypothetical protein n=1 Tax=Streptomyces lavendulae TaxID=1914 RepID=UPI0036AB44CA
MTLVDDIEFYGRAVQAGEMEREQAVRLLVEASEGGLTEYGASTALANWSTARASYTEAFEQAADGLAAARRFL